MASDTISQGTAGDGSYRFRPLTAEDLPLLRRWLAETHVRRWWGEPDDELAMVTDLMAADWAALFMVESKDIPIAYLQAYDASKAGPEWPDLPAGYWGVDTLIGPPEAIGRGHGPAYLRAFGDWFLERPGVDRLYADPAPDNRASIRAFEKAGFAAVRSAPTPHGPALFMTRSKKGC